ncbi:MAG TPA: hypothetical protein VGP82_19335 [Ktedonobacterales bacterium]|nr:hypothetical protein [Ktedonobacterales bacterium]
MQRFQPIGAIPGAPYSHFRMREARYHGRPSALPEGTRVARGDAIVELQFNNRKLSEVVGGTSTRRLAPVLGEGLQALARWMSRPDRNETDAARGLRSRRTRLRGRAPRLPGAPATTRHLHLTGRAVHDRPTRPPTIPKRRGDWSTASAMAPLLPRSGCRARS